MYAYFMLSIMNRLGLTRPYVTCTFASALVSKGQISIWHICLILKLINTTLLLLYNRMNHLHFIEHTYQLIQNRFIKDWTDIQGTSCYSMAPNVAGTTSEKAWNTPVNLVVKVNPIQRISWGRVQSGILIEGTGVETIFYDRFHSTLPGMKTEYSDELCQYHGCQGTIETPSHQYSWWYWMSKIGGPFSFTREFSTAPSQFIKW